MDDFSTWLATTLKEHRMSQTEFANRLGLSQSLVSKVLSGSKKPSADFCLKAAAVLSLSPLFVLKLAGLVGDEEKPTKDNPMVREVTELARQLPPGRLKQLLEFAKLLRRGE